MTAIADWILTGGTRTLARRLGLARLSGAPGRLRSAARRRRFVRERPARVELQVPGGPILAATSSPEEYARALTLQDDSPLLQALVRRVRPGDVVWDIGANLGLYSIALARAVGPEGQVVAFEPEPRAMARLRCNVALNRVAEVRPIAAALGDRAGELPLLVAPTGVDGTHTLIAAASSEAATRAQVLVSVARGDDLVRTGELDPPHVVKLDVEGAEALAIDGLRETLASPGLRAILIEVHFAVLAAAGDEAAPRRILAALHAAGLTRHTWIDRSHLLAERS